MRNVLKYEMVLKGMDSISVSAAQYESLKSYWTVYATTKKNQPISFAEFDFMASDIRSFRPIEYKQAVDGVKTQPGYTNWICYECGTKENPTKVPWDQDMCNCQKAELEYAKKTQEFEHKEYIEKGGKLEFFKWLKEVKIPSYGF